MWVMGSVNKAPLTLLLWFSALVGLMAKRDLPTVNSVSPMDNNNCSGTTPVW